METERASEVRQQGRRHAYMYKYFCASIYEGQKVEFGYQECIHKQNDIHKLKKDIRFLDFYSWPHRGSNVHHLNQRTMLLEFW